MNDEGWIAGSVIAGFNRVRMLTPDLAVIVSALADSATVEVASNGLSFRPRENWRKLGLTCGAKGSNGACPSVKLLGLVG